MKATQGEKVFVNCRRNREVQIEEKSDSTCAHPDNSGYPVSQIRRTNLRTSLRCKHCKRKCRFDSVRVKREWWPRRNRDELEREVDRDGMRRRRGEPVEPNLVWPEWGTSSVSAAACFLLQSRTPTQGRNSVRTVYQEWARIVWESKIWPAGLPASAAPLQGESNL